MAGKSGEPTVGTNWTDEGHLQLGVTVEGVFVPFVTKNAGYIEHLKAQAKATPTEPESES